MSSIKDTIKWFPFIATIYHTANILKPHKGQIPSLLKVFDMLQLCLFYDKNNAGGNTMDAMAIRCSNCDLFQAKTSTFSTRDLI